MYPEEQAEERGEDLNESGSAVWTMFRRLRFVILSHTVIHRNWTSTFHLPDSCKAPAQLFLSFTHP